MRGAGCGGLQKKGMISLSEVNNEKQKTYLITSEKEYVPTHSEIHKKMKEKEENLIEINYKYTPETSMQFKNKLHDIQIKYKSIFIYFQPGEFENIYRMIKRSNSDYQQKSHSLRNQEGGDIQPKKILDQFVSKIKQKNQENSEEKKKKEREEREQRECKLLERQKKKIILFNVLFEFFYVGVIVPLSDRRFVELYLEKSVLDGSLNVSYSKFSVLANIGEMNIDLKGDDIHYPHSIHFSSNKTNNLIFNFTYKINSSSLYVYYSSFLFSPFFPPFCLFPLPPLPCSPFSLLPRVPFPPCLAPSFSFLFPLFSFFPRIAFTSFFFVLSSFLLPSSPPLSILYFIINLLASRLFPASIGFLLFPSHSFPPSPSPFVYFPFYYNWIY